MPAVLPPALEAASVPEPVLDVLARLGEGGFEAFLVGGCVRDLLLGRTPKDFDVATRAHPPEVQRLFKKVIPTGIEHGTVTVLSRGHPVEVTTYRQEAEYLDGRRPSRIAFHHDIEEDLARRDFTINAMAFNPLTRRLEDPFGGQHDLLARLVRCVGDAAERFGEDGLRPLRAVRIATVLEFGLDRATEAAIPPALPVFRKVALERVHDELVKLLLCRDVERGLGLLRSTGLLGVFLPELADEAALPIYQAVSRAAADEVTRLAVLLSPLGDARPALLRLKFPNKVLDRVVLLRKHPLPKDAAQASDADLRRWMAKVGAAEAETGWAAAAALGLERADEVRARLRALLGQNPPLTPKALALDGQAIMAALGVGPSAVVGEASRFLMEQVLEDPSRNTAQTLRELLVAWGRRRGAG